MEFTGYLTEEEAKTLQKAAHEFVFGKAPTADTSYKAVDPIQFVLKTDERFANQTFPKNYEALYATALAYFERGIFVQYDQLALDRVNFSFNRRSVSLSSPEYGTAQTPLYLDCTAFVWSILKTAFDYELSANRSKPLTYNDLTETIVYEEHITNSTDTDAAIATFLASLQPGDVIAYSNPSNDRGHGVLYLGNGYIIQCSSASHLDTGNADYQYKQKHDSHEGNGGVRIDKIDFMTDPLKLSYQFNPSNDMTIRIIRPDYSKMTPTEDTVNRVNNLMHIVASKETSAPAGVSVNPGDDVTFTIVIKNVGAESKTVSVTDTLPAGVTLKSGSNDFSVTVAPGETVKTSYTVTVAASVAKGTHIDYEGTKAGGVSLGNTPIYVASTLSAADQTKLSDAAKAVKSASDTFAIAAAAYKAIGVTLPFSDTDAACDAILGKDKSGDTDVVYLKTDSAQFKLIADGLFGGSALVNSDNTYRIKYVSYYNLVAGDIVLCRTTDNTVYSYLYLGNAEFMTVRAGKIVTISGTAPCREILERLFGENGFAVIRPSLGK